MSENCEGCAVSDCTYNVMKQLVKLNQLLSNIDGYIKDARKDGHEECAKALEQLRADSRKNAEKLKAAVENTAKNGSL